MNWLFDNDMNHRNIEVFGLIATPSANRLLQISENPDYCNFMYKIVVPPKNIDK